MKKQKIHHAYTINSLPYEKTAAFPPLNCAEKILPSTINKKIEARTASILLINIRVKVFKGVSKNDF